jgi:hypothetical protein
MIYSCQKTIYPRAIWLADGCRAGVGEPGMMYNVWVVTRETHAALAIVASMADDATNGGSQMAARESDAVIVPMISGNAEGGKAGTQLGPVQGTHSLYSGIGD